jgi:hypothetical protein
MKLTDAHQWQAEFGRFYAGAVIDPGIWGAGVGLHVRHFFELEIVLGPFTLYAHWHGEIK